MSRALTLLNLLGVIILAGLCALQWRTNRALNLEINRLEQVRLAQLGRIAEQARDVSGLKDDLERFRTQLADTTLSFKETSTKLRAAEKLSDQLANERDQLKAAIAQWTAAVATRDERLTEANTRIRDLASRLTDAATRYNDLVATHNALVKQIEDARAAANAAAAAAQKDAAQ